MATPVFTATNARPVDLTSADITPALAGDDCYDIKNVIAGLVDKVFLQPLSPGSDVLFTDDTGAGYTRTEIAEKITDALLDENDTDTNSTAAAMLEAMTRHSRADHNLPVNQLMLSQALGATGLPSTMGSAIVRYDVGTDIIPTATDYLALVNNPGTRNYDRAVDHLTTFYAGLASLYYPEGHAIAFSDDTAFSRFTTAVHDMAQTLVSAGQADQSVLTRAAELTKMTLDKEIVTGIRLRSSDTDITDDYSFARLVSYVAHDVAADEHARANTDDRAPEAHLMPFSITSLINPSNLLFINMENHSRSAASKIVAAWTDIVNSTNNPINMVSLKKLSKINAVSSNISKMQGAIAANAQKRVKATADSRRDASESDFSSRPVTPAASARDILAKLKTMASQNQSKNIYLTKRKTYGRPSRRNRIGDNMFQAPGKIKRKTYYPDIHFYADTSGSMSIEDYQDTLVLIAQIANKLKCDFYFSTFSHVLSSEVLLPTKGRTPAQVQEIIRRIPKVTGGTDFQQIWDNINRLDSKKRRLNIVSTDFGYTPRAWPAIDHPENVVYVPAFNRKDDYAWNWVKKYAAKFANDMRRHDPTIDHKLLGMR